MHWNIKITNQCRSGTALTNLNHNSISNPPAIVSFNNAATFISTLNVSGNTTLNNASPLLSTLNVSEKPTTVAQLKIYK